MKIMKSIHTSSSLIAVVSAFAVPSQGYIAVQPTTSHLSDNQQEIPLPKGVADTTRVGSLEVPNVGIGTISWSSESFLSLENKELEQVVSKAYKSNAAFFDTAERSGSHAKTALGMGYGETEKLTKKLLRRAQDENIENRMASAVVATKFTPLPWRTSVQSVIDACEQSRKNLGVDQIDLYQIHMPDIVQPLRFLGRDKVKDEMYWDGVAECYHRGLVKNVGVCNYGPTLVEQCQEALAKRGVPLASNQIGYSLLGRHNGAQETVDRCNDLGVKVLAYYPFAMGLLTGKYSKDIVAGVEGKDLSLTQFKKSGLELKDLERYALGDGNTVPNGGIAPLLSSMSTIAESRGKTISQVALNYVISKGAVPIPGCRTVSQLEDNLGALGWRLTESEIELLELEADKLGFGFDGAGFKRTSEKFVGYGVEKWSLV